MMKPKVLKTEEEYQEALAYVETLMDAVAGTPEMEALELFSMLVQKYEDEHYPIDLPDPIAAIEFRMEQQGLTRKDLVQYIGSQSKVSEVMNRKRPLSLAMIRALHAGLGIPAEVLLQQPGKELEQPAYDYSRFPVAAMHRRGYFPAGAGSLREIKEKGEEYIGSLLAVFENQQPQRVFAKRSEGQVDGYALLAWQAQVMKLAAALSLPAYEHGRVTPDFMRDVARLSYFEQGPLLAQEELHKKGIPLIILPHLPHTYLDGACFRTPAGRAVVGMTLRQDREDNFWFTLVHELAHIHLHLGDASLVFFDDTEPSIAETGDPREEEANRLTRDLLIPPAIWERERERLLNASRVEVIAIAGDLHLSPAIVAGRIRWEKRNFMLFDDLIGRKRLGKLFQTENERK